MRSVKLECVERATFDYMGYVTKATVRYAEIVHIVQNCHVDNGSHIYTFIRKMGRQHALLVNKR